jgi:hypothetical protein
VEARPLAGIFSSEAETFEGMPAGSLSRPGVAALTMEAVRCSVHSS